MLYYRYIGDMKKKIDRAYVTWCCKSCRPLSMGETDHAFKDFLLAVSSGRYVAPARKVALEELVVLSAGSQRQVSEELNEILNKDFLDISISGAKPLPIICYRCVMYMETNITFHAGDIWSENGISVFAVTGYWISGGHMLKLRERLLICIPFTKDSHTGENIKKLTLEGLHKKWGIGQTVEDVPDRVHGCTPDAGSNMLAGWNIFEGELGR